MINGWKRESWPPLSPYQHKSAQAPLNQPRNKGECVLSLFGQRKSDVFIMFHDSCSPWVHLSAEDVGVKWCQQTSERKEGVQHADSCYQWLDRAVMQGRHQSSLGGIPNTRRTHTDREREREAHPHMTNRNRKTWTHWTLNFLLSWVQVWQLIGWESHLLFSNASTTNGLTRTHTHTSWLWKSLDLLTNLSH